MTQDIKRKCTVIMLPTSKVSKLYIFRNILTLNNYEAIFQEELQGQHLYILSDEPIKEEDYGLVNGVQVVKCLHNNTAKYWNEQKVPKVIATTDKDLDACEFCDGVNNKIHNHLSQIPESFVKTYIETYNQGNVITEVLVEYEKFEKWIGNAMHGKNIMINQPKLNKDNTIIINEAIIPTGSDINKTTNDIYINNKNYTVNHLIKDLQALNETYRRNSTIY